MVRAPAARAQQGYVPGDPALAYWRLEGPRGGSPVLIVLHGGPAAGSAYLRPEWDTLRAGCTVVYYDQRGAGKSGGAECYSWQSHLDDLRRVVRHFGGGRKVILAGSSWGSQLALLYAHTHPGDVSALILSGTVAWQGKGGPARPCADYRARATDYPGFDTAMAYVSLETRRVVRDLPSDSGEVRRLLGARYFEAPFAARIGTSLSLREAPKLEQLRVSMPVLLFEGKGHCTESAFVKDAAAAYYPHLPAAGLVSMEAACHDPWFTHPALFFAACRAFIEEVRQDGGR